MSTEAVKASRRPSASRSRAGGEQQTWRDDIAALRARGDNPVSVTVSWSGAGHRIAFDMSGAQAAELVKAAGRNNKPKHVGLSPNAALVEALNEGQMLKGRFASAEELFDALETEG